MEEMTKTKLDVDAEFMYLKPCSKEAHPMPYHHNLNHGVVTAYVLLREGTRGPNVFPWDKMKGKLVRTKGRNPKAVNFLTYNEDFKDVEARMDWKDMAEFEALDDDDFNEKMDEASMDRLMHMAEYTLDPQFGDVYGPAKALPGDMIFMMGDTVRMFGPRLGGVGNERVYSAIPYLRLTVKGQQEMGGNKKLYMYDICKTHLLKTLGQAYSYEKKDEQRKNKLVLWAAKLLHKMNPDLEFARRCVMFMLQYTKGRIKEADMDKKRKQYRFADALLEKVKNDSFLTEPTCEPLTPEKDRMAVAAGLAKSPATGDDESVND